MAVRSGDIGSYPATASCHTAIPRQQRAPRSRAASVRFPAVARSAAIATALAAAPAGTAFAATTGHTSRELYALGDGDRCFYLSGSMGYTSTFALGLALAVPDVPVVALDGDGAALMHLGNLATLGTFAPGTLRHVVLDNGVHASTGGQPTVSRNVDFPAAALALGYRAASAASEFASLGDAFGWLFAVEGPALLHVHVGRSTLDNLPRVNVALHDQVARFGEALQR